MKNILNRRRFIQAASSAVAAGALSSVATRSRAQSSGELRVLVNGGDVGKSNIEAYVKPFEAETGVKVTPITQDFDFAKLELMVKSNNVTIDVGPMAPGGALPAGAKGYLEKIDYSIYKKDELDGIFEFAKDQFGVASLIYSYNMVYNTKKLSPDKRPANWAEFWDVAKFPGTRFLVSGQYGSEGPWEEALMADGVDPLKLYPMDIDRIFASLDNIKPHIRKWWSNGSEIQQLMNGGTGDVMNSYDGRAISLIDKGSPIEISRNQAKLTWDYWVIPKGGPNVQNAQRFVEFATRAERQAAFSKLYPEGPSNRNAFKLIADDVARKLPTHPDYMTKSIPINGGWYAEVGSDGLSNTQRLAQRWSEWVLR
ncbi:ABC transporter substrate-binding protein [Mesorhizobium atlanticum]|uniref:ABC transporter substrate-binding protein n=1 Tax=Mesorhizobium atlanticum TaxID=2233532 RepID=A0A330GHY6_9HYPH|nr:ABC transporter substrate-binding protein [Mesorhizobium atlanticum]RAZ71152.1 ABC transporter substrate-binding protein [Mesorhizobium atlanticum]